mgnify:CR=1 FL=1
MNELHLFAGAGGGILGGMLLGHTCVCAVEIEEYPRKVLLQRQRDGILPHFPIWDDIQTFDGKPWRGRVDVVAGGFPCVDISSAGRGAGIEGKRSGLWREMARVIGEIQPRFVFVENTPLLVGRGLAVVLGDLAKMGYDARWGVLGADDAGSPHRRKRIWLLANSGSLGSAARIPEPEQREKGNSKEFDHNCCGHGTGKNAEIRHPTSAGLPHGTTEQMGEPGSNTQPERPGWWTTEPWVEWLMGWPLEWTDLKPLGTDRFRMWPHSPGKF